jgi:hypothetical protein
MEQSACYGLEVWLQTHLPNPINVRDGNNQNSRDMLP